MTYPAADFEAAVWRGLRDLGIDRRAIAPNIVANILDAADTYARQTGGLVAERRAARDDARQAAIIADAQNNDTADIRAQRRRALARATGRRRTT